MEYLFYTNSDERKAGQVSLSAEYSWTLWKPYWTSILPDGLPLIPFTMWWVFHHAGIFSNPGYGILVVYHGKALVHRSCIFPRYFRFPFMKDHDLQIGDIWTAPAYRGKGLATFAIEKIVELHNRLGRQFWFVVERKNKPSIRAAERAGFIKVGEGIRARRFGVKIFGSYVIQKN